MSPPSKIRIPIAAVDREYAALRATVVPAVTSVLESTRFILGPEVDGVRGRGRRGTWAASTPSGAATAPTRSCSRCAPRDRPRRRGHRAGLHVRGDGGGRRARRRDARLRRHRARHVRDRPALGGRARRARGRARSCPFTSSASARRMEPLLELAERHVAAHRRGRRAGPRRALARQGGGRARPRRGVQLLPDEEPRRARRRRHRDDVRRARRRAACAPCGRTAAARPMSTRPSATTAASTRSTPRSCA